MIKILRRTLVVGGVLLTAGAVMAMQPPGGVPVDVIVGVQGSGTAQWEMEVIKSQELDKKHGINLILRDVADSRAGQVALQAGEVDIILSDFVWAAIQRNQGNLVTVVPHSLAVGGVMVGPDSGISSVDDLVGKRIGIAGGPVDKSWIVLQAYYGQTHDDKLVDLVDASFGSPPLINELLANGEIDAALNFWHFNARSKAAGMVELKSVADMLSEMGADVQPPLLGWVFTDETAAEMPDAVKGFLDASFDAKNLLLKRDTIWNGLRELMRAADDDTLFETLREDYRAGIIESYNADTVTAAAESFAMMAEFGGSELVGDVPTMADGTFWAEYSR